MIRPRDHHQLSATFPPQQESARQAREFVVAGLRETGVDESDLVDRVRLIVSELVTNAVLHAQTDIQVRLDVAPSQVCLEVLDQHRAHPSRVPESLSSTSGRGLQLVDALTDTWGVAAMADGQGKAVWGCLGRG